MPDPPRRPTPEEMLVLAEAEAARAHRGRLKIFFGASPGVGKTYAMLEAAQAKRATGIDIVIGWVETHKRAETDALTAGLERIPSRTLDYRGMSVQEFDLDAALKRRPALLLLDELAHTNAEGSRHGRRYQDAVELLEAGIDVYTTLNVQHVESLNDVVAQITGVVVRETVPDSILDMADEIELIDISPDVLLQRLREGKVYIPGQAERALRHFFREGNLTALRELALRRTAERVDAQLAEYRRAQGIVEPWPTRERILVAVSAAPRSANVIRAASRMAARLQAPWIALAIETPATDRHSQATGDRLTAHLELATQLGAETVIVRGEEVSEELLAFARERNVTRIVVGTPSHPWWVDRLRGSLIERIVRNTPGIDVLVTSGEESVDAQREATRSIAPEPIQLSEYLLALAVMAVCTGFNMATRPVFELADQAMVYLLGVVLVASRLSRRPSFVAAVLAVVLLNFFFVPPFHTFAVNDFRHVLTFAVMLVVGLIVSTLTLRIRGQAEAARQRERRTAALYAMSRDFAAETAIDQLTRIAIGHIHDFCETEEVLYLSDRTGLPTLVAGERTLLATSEREIAVARWVFDHGHPAGYGTQTLPAAAGLYLPLSGARGVFGVLGIRIDSHAHPLSKARLQLLETYVGHTALALERAMLAAETADSHLAIETERTRSSLLSAVSHDLRTPLAAISGSAEALLDPAAPLPDTAREDLLRTIRDESQRLGTLVTNLLNLTRLEAGFHLATTWEPVEEIIDAAVERLRTLPTARLIDIHVPHQILALACDPVLLEQALFNLLDNALKHTPSDTPIEVRASQDHDQVIIDVCDRGPGLPPGEEARIFDQFYRAPDGLRATGAGLGLAVTRAIAKVHDGTLSVANRPDGGACFRLTLPQGLPPAPDPETPTP